MLRLQAHSPYAQVGIECTYASLQSKPVPGTGLEPVLAFRVSSPSGAFSSPMHALVVLTQHHLKLQPSPRGPTAAAFADVQRNLGHSTPVVTVNTYGHLGDDHRIAEADKRLSIGVRKPRLAVVGEG